MDFTDFNDTEKNLQSLAVNPGRPLMSVKIGKVFMT